MTFENDFDFSPILGFSFYSHKIFEVPPVQSVSLQNGSNCVIGIDPSSSSGCKKERDISIYEDDFCAHAIELRGGRATPDELENMGLRVISKNPDNEIKRLVSKLQQHLKKK